MEAVRFWKKGALDLDTAKRDRSAGWWFSCADEAFGFLRNDLDFDVETVMIHFRGLALAYSSSRYVIRLAFDEESALLGCDLYPVALYESETPQFVSAEGLLKARAPDGDWTVPPAPWTREVVAGVYCAWSAGLQLHCLDVLRGAIPHGVPWRSPW